MTTLTRWEPFRELATMRNAMDRFFEDRFFDFPFRWPTTLESVEPAIDLSEDANAYTITASLPGVKPEEVEITYTGNMLTIKGESKQDQEIKEENYHRRERHYGSFMRTIELPMTVKADEIEATNQHGVLTLRLPKSEEVKPKKITVKNGIESKVKA